MSINITVPEGTDEATRDLVRRAVDGALAARDGQWLEIIAERDEESNTRVQLVAQRVAEALHVHYSSLPSTSTANDAQRAATIALDVIRRAMPDVVAAVNAPKVQRIEHDEAGRIKTITTTAA